MVQVVQSSAKPSMHPTSEVRGRASERKKLPCGMEGCSTKVNIVAQQWQCRCGEHFCPHHRDIVAHNCPMDSGFVKKIESATKGKFHKTQAGPNACC